LTACIDSEGSFSCTDCPEFHTGTGLTGCEYQNQCGSNNGGCDALVACTDTDHARLCDPCPEGYHGSGYAECNDVNECDSYNGGCDALTVCINSVGSSSCTPCPSDYVGTGLTGCISAITQVDVRVKYDQLHREIGLQCPFSGQLIAVITSATYGCADHSVADLDYIAQVEEPCVAHKACLLDGETLFAPLACHDGTSGLFTVYYECATGPDVFTGPILDVVESRVEKLEKVGTNFRRCLEGNVFC